MGIEVKGLSYAYERGKPVLRELSFPVDTGSFVCLLGPNGVGKSTLFKCMLGLLPCGRGHIFIDGADMADFTPRRLSRKLAYIPQSTAPVFNYSVADAVLMGTTARTALFSSPGQRERACAEKAMELLGIRQLAGRPYANISGGERQLVLIARALAQQADYLFMDEPTANLDYGNQIKVLERVRALTREGYTVIQSTHSPEQAFLYADSVVAVKDGRIAALGAPNAVMDSALLSSLYSAEVSVESLRGGTVRVCVPGAALKGRR